MPQIVLKTVWPSGLRRWLQAPVRKGVGRAPQLPLRSATAARVVVIAITILDIIAAVVIISSVPVGRRTESGPGRARRRNSRSHGGTKRNRQGFRQTTWSVQL